MINKELIINIIKITVIFLLFLLLTIIGLGKYQNIALKKELK